MALFLTINYLVILIGLGSITMHVNQGLYSINILGNDNIIVICFFICLSLVLFIAAIYYWARCIWGILLFVTYFGVLITFIALKQIELQDFIEITSWIKLDRIIPREEKLTWLIELRQLTTIPQNKWDIVIQNIPWDNINNKIQLKDFIAMEIKQLPPDVELQNFATRVKNFFHQHRTIIYVSTGIIIVCGIACLVYFTNNATITSLNTQNSPLDNQNSLLSIIPELRDHLEKFPANSANFLNDIGMLQHQLSVFHQVCFNGELPSNIDLTPMRDLLGNLALVATKLEQVSYHNQTFINAMLAILSHFE